jgi:hypothetical protein
MRLWGPKGIPPCWEPSSYLEHGSSTGILRVQQDFSTLVCSSAEALSESNGFWESLYSSPLGVSGFRLVEIPMTLPQSGWFANHSKLSNHFSYSICAFTYRMIESDIVLLYIRSHVWGNIYAVEPGVTTVQTPRRPSLWHMAAEGPRHSHRRGVGGIVYARGAPGHTDCCGTRKSDSPIKTS